MVRYIRPGNDALIKALSASGVPISLSSTLSGQGATPLDVELFAKDVGGGTSKAIQSIDIAGTTTVITQARGNLGALQQRASTLELLVQERFAGADIDPRSIRALSGLSDTIQPLGSLLAPFNQDVNANAQVSLFTAANVAYDARDTSDRAAREVGRVRPWGNQNNFSTYAEATSPIAGAAIIATAPLAANDYTLSFSLWAADTNAVGKRAVIAHRNAADNGDVKILTGCAVPGQIQYSVTRYSVGASEFFRARVGAAGAAGSIYGAYLEGKVAG